MRDDLLGYLLGALEPDEEREVERRLEQDGRLRRELRVMARGLLPLSADDGLIDPPAGLAERVAAQIARAAPAASATRCVARPQGRAVASSPSSDAAPTAGRSWGLTDVAVLSGIAVAVAILVLPALSSARYQSQIVACRNRMHRLGTALVNYSRLHGDAFPEVLGEGPLARAGVFVPRLKAARLIDDFAEVVCPCSGGAGDDQAYSIPSLEELAQAETEQADMHFARLGGSYGYALGYVEDGRYHTLRNRHRADFAVLADVPRGDGRGSLNHGCGGQNVWFEDGHVDYLNCCRLEALDEQIFRNREGFVGAGIGPDDVVIAPGNTRPLVTPAKFER